MSDTPAKSALEQKLESLNAVYHRFGVEGLKDTPISDVSMLLASKQLELRDVRKDRNFSEERMAEGRKLELEIRDLTNLMNVHLTGAGLNTISRFLTSQPSQSYEKPKTKDFERDR